MLAAALILGVVMGIGFDVRWFLCCALKILLPWLIDIIYLLVSAFLMFFLFQISGGSARADLLCFALGTAALYEALLGDAVHRALSRFALLLRQPIDYAKKQLEKIIFFMKKNLANAKNWYMILLRRSCLRVFFPRRGEKERSFATDNGGIETAASHTDAVRVTYSAECGPFADRSPAGAGASGSNVEISSGGKRTASAAYRRNRRKRKVGVHSPAAAGTGKSRRNSDI